MRFAPDRVTKSSVSCLAVVVCVLVVSCTSLQTAATGPKSRTAQPSATPSGKLDQLALQALVMEMADEYIAALGQAICLIAAERRAFLDDLESRREQL